MVKAELYLAANNALLAYHNEASPSIILFISEIYETHPDCHGKFKLDIINLKIKVLVLYFQRNCPHWNELSHRFWVKLD